MAGLVRDRSGIAWPVSADAIENSDANIRYPAPVTAPLTQYADSRPLRSAVNRSFEYASPLNAAIVSRHSRRQGEYHYVHGGERQPVAVVPDPVRSSDFQTTQVSLAPWFINTGWYIAYPAASISQGTDRNLGLAERTPQLTTRVAGGPGPRGTRMGPRPQFTRVQTIPRYPTAPATYETTSSRT